jgi:hypothetical protein
VTSAPPRGRRTYAPVVVSGALALALRGVLAAAQWRDNPALRTPSLDAAYYLDWAREIGAGNLLSAGPAGAAGPYLLNPLYAWTIAPLVSGAGGAPQPSILALQALLGGATAAFAAEAARRHASALAGDTAGRGAGAAAEAARERAGAIAAWVAGLAVAFSTALVHLATHVAVATLAGFLVSGAALACAPRPGGGSTTKGAARFPGLAAGIWLGVGALARPVTLLALPLVAWCQSLRGGRRAAAWTVVAFAACAGVSFTRNTVVSGEPVVFTAADGLNLHLGNNPMARRTRSMITDDFRFGPVEMHEDARHRVGFALGREPSRSEVSAWYRDDAVREFAAAPGASLLFHLHKLRWFLSPAEPPSSADLTVDAERVPPLRAAFVPTWLIAVLAAAGAWLARRDRALLLGAGGLVAAHVVSCTLAFPLEHYRAPAIPALAVLAGCGVAQAFRAGVRDRNVAIRIVVAASLVAWVPPQPSDVPAVLHANRTTDAVRARDSAAALREATAALADDPAWAGARLSMASAQLLAGNLELARAYAGAVVRSQPWNVPARRLEALLSVDVGLPDTAVASAEELVEALPWSAEARGLRGEVRAFTGDVEGARADLAWAMDRGHRPRPEVLDRAGMRTR